MSTSPRVSRSGLAILLWLFGFVAVAAAELDPRLPPGASPDWWATVERSLRAEEYHFTAAGADAVDRWRAPNRAHGFRVELSPDGLRLTSGCEAAASWDWGLSFSGWGRPGRVESAGTAMPSASANRFELRRPGLVEWYLNDERGIEQGFQIARRADGVPGEPLVLDFALAGFLRPDFTVDGQAIDFFGTASIGVLRLSGLRVIDAAGTTLPSRFEPIPGGLRIRVDDESAVYPLTVDPLATSPAWSATGAASSSFGKSVATAGDVNGDGYSDVIVGAPGFSTATGKVWVYPGGPGGLSTAAMWSATGLAASTAFGTSVATAGDVNGDGYSDVLVGSPGSNMAFLFLGGATGPESSASWLGVEGLDDFGHSVASAGDVNGDGFSDVVIGSRVGSGFGRGAAYLVLGSSLGLQPSASWDAHGENESDYFGESVAGAGDLNGDGYSDVVVGAVRYPNGADTGKAYAYLGGPGGLSATAAWTAGPVTGNRFGIAVSSAGDVNGDGYAEIAVGSEGGVGKVSVFLGGASGPALAESWSAAGEALGSSFGSGLATAGDVNGDGYSDLVVGDPAYSTNSGKAYLFLGGPTGLAAAASWALAGTAGSLYGGSVATAGDVNGDGYSDLVVGEPGYSSSGGRASVYLGSASGPAGTARLTVSGDETGALLGRVASAGDVNGDGFGDVLVGAPSHDAGGVDRGRVYLFLGAVGGPELFPAWTASGTADSGFFGSSSASAGDVNGDGYGDVVVGASSDPAGGTNRGKAWVYLGSAAGLSTTPVWTVAGDENSAYFGQSVASAGDVDGDGDAEILVGAYGHDGGGAASANRGRVFLYSGSPAGVSLTPTWIATGDEDGASFGISVASAGDVHGDGYSDVLIGAYFHDGGGGAGANRGMAYLYRGSASGLGTWREWLMAGDENSAEFGGVVASAGDVNGDGYSDVIIGARAHDAGAGAAANRGRAYVYLGSASGLAGSAGWVGSGDESAANFGISVASAGDLNGDGYSDILVGANFHDAGAGAGANRGRAYAYFGSASGPLPLAGWTLSGDANSALLGVSVASGRDVDGDGFSDILVGANAHPAGGSSRGRAYCFLGNGNAAGEGGVSMQPLQRRVDGSAPVAPMGLAFEGMFQLGLRLRSPFGRGRARLEWQSILLGDTWLPNPVAKESLWWNSGTGGLARRKTVGLPDQEGVYSWRARVGWHPAATPLQSHGPWFSVPGNGWLSGNLRSTSALPPPACVLPDEPLWLYSVVKVGTDYTLNFQDPNQPAQRTGYHVRRSNDPGPDPSAWPLEATNVVDMDAGAANIQWTDHSGDDPAPSAVWYYQVTAYNAACPAEGPF